MYKRTAMLVLVFALGCTAAMAQRDAFLGTWKMDPAQSTYNPGPPPKSQTVTWERWQGGYKAIVDTITAQGKSTHFEVTFKLDGKPHPMPRAGRNTTVTFKRMDHSFENVTRVNGKMTFASRRVVSRDGKTFTLTQTGTNAQGQTVNNRIVYTRQ
ncbi:MAG TPA: hypothetical protein VNJ52_02545 [Patescibacteria group bacterium]|nr:hypothetical protein [Patescibacteria group bacterium]